MVFRLENLTSGRNDDLSAKLWTDGDPHQGVVIIVHGLGDHSDRFSSLAKTLTGHGWGVLAFDLPGHGRSPGKQGQVGRFDEVLADIAAGRRIMADRFPGLRQVILGHSMGGNLALSHVLRHREWPTSTGSTSSPLGGLVLLAPMILPPNPPPRPMIFAAWMTGYLLPWVGIQRRLDISKLTRDADQAIKIRDDKLMHSRISIYLATQLLSQGRWSLDHAREVDIPTLIMYGESDALIDVSACEHLAIRIGELATRATWPDMQHDLLHERDRQQVTERLVTWLDDL